ncbi:DUF6843 domain-containing protein [Bacillus xiapuensis]|uniref:DUF6843 domain-containing protein n=1 Tax=Bacillus xiapuensis TaxID=2014075 RepID=A0ABU6NI39_9BACI|nr:hypothetical protein [Bacillus xiapuensis]
MKKIILISFILLSGCSNDSYTNTIHIVPENFEGTLTATYNVDGAPALEKEKGFSVIPYNDAGFYETSTSDMEYGTVNDKFYYEINNKRIPISEECIFYISTGSAPGDNNKRYPQSHIAITNNCSKDFQMNGPDEFIFP